MKITKKKWVALALALLMALSMGSTVQAAGNKKGNNEVETKVLAQAPYGGSRVVAYDQGVRYNGQPVIETRSNPNAVLTYETGKVESNFYSLGFSMAKDGWIIIEFNYPIKNGEGNDLRIVEDTWGLPYPRESAAVYVSKNGRRWTYLGEADNQKPVSNIQTITEFDLQDVGMKEARYVMVKDTSVRSDFDKYSPSQDRTLDGFDLNAVLALHDYVVKIDSCCDDSDESGCGSWDDCSYWNRYSWFFKTGSDRFFRSCSFFQ